MDRLTQVTMPRRLFPYGGFASGVVRLCWQHRVERSKTVLAMSPCRVYLEA